MTLTTFYPIKNHQQEQLTDSKESIEEFKSFCDQDEMQMLKNEESVVVLAVGGLNQQPHFEVTNSNLRSTADQ